MWQRLDTAADLGPATAPRDWRGFWLQAVAVFAAVAVFVFLAANVIANIDRLGVETGFSFLSRPAGFDIAQKLIPYTSSSTYFAAFIVALLNTALLAAICCILSTALGLAVGLARLSSNPLVAGLAAGFIELMRNIPLLLHLLFWYFVVIRPLPSPRDGIAVLDLVFLSNRGLALPAPVMDHGLLAMVCALAIGFVGSIAIWKIAQTRKALLGSAGAAGWLAPLPLLLLPAAASLLGVADISWDVPELRGFNHVGGARIIPEFIAMVIGLSVYSAAFVAEIFRGGFNAVPKGQREAGLALGLPVWLLNLKIVIPLALRAVVPPLGAQYVLILKNSSLAAAIAYPDLMLIFAGTALNQTGQPLEVMFMTLSAYLVLGLAIAVTTTAWNRRLRLVTR